MRHPLNPGLPELQELPAIAQKDINERNVLAIARKALPPMPQIDFMGEGPSLEQIAAAEENAAKRVAYFLDRERLKAARRGSRYEDRQLSRALANRDKVAQKMMRKRGNAQNRYAGQRMKNIARSIGLGPELFRVLR